MSASAPGTVEVRHVWKRFRADRGRRLMRDHVGRAAQRVTGRSGPNPWRWALKEIDFKAEPGESIGFIGANGAGKSTLLKIVSGVMFPHTGRVNVQGRIGALLEVASGIHPELTGRENINIFGTLIGLTRPEVASKFDEIVAFAELESAVDRQVKFYSSGMRTRLGFSIAAFLEPEVLVVDEVLAVGDQLFQQKCLDRMRTVLEGGATLLLVSHDLASVGATASRGIWLSEGVMRADGPIDDVLAAYRREIEEKSGENSRVQGEVSARLLGAHGADGGRIETNRDCAIDLVVTSNRDRPVQMYVGVSQGPATPIFVLSKQFDVPEGDTAVSLHLAHLPLPRGNYYVWFAVHDPLQRVARRGAITEWQPMGGMVVEGNARLDPTPRAIVRLSPVFVEADWSVGESAVAGR
ncbi:MAG TPA: ABC transporter ATP-binding protein [Acidimicrobiia bacterium]|jgi:ABC-2 type transport system ATP-binding protein